MTGSAENAGTQRDGADQTDRVMTRIKEFANLIAPVTLITSLLLYFGYIGTRARLEYFGVYLDMTGLSNQDLILSGLEVIYFPAAMIFLALLFAAALHGTVTWLLTDNRRDVTMLILAASVLAIGVLAIGRALLGLLRVQVSQAEVPGTTALALALGPCLVAYGAWIGWQVLRRRASGKADPPLLAWYAKPEVRRVRQAAAAGMVGLLVAGLFWATNSFAWAFGSGRAYEEAQHLAERPEVVIDTKTRMVDVPPGVVETVLGESEADVFRYRYNGLRLLIEADRWLYLVPAEWAEGSRTLVVPYNEDVRIQLAP